MSDDRPQPPWHLGATYHRGREWGEGAWTAPDVAEAERREEHERELRVMEALTAYGAIPLGEETRARLHADLDLPARPET